MWPYILPILCLKISWKLRLFLVIFLSQTKLFINDKNLSHFSNNVRKYKLVNAVIAVFDKNMRQMTKTPQQKMGWRLYQV